MTPMWAWPEEFFDHDEFDALFQKQGGGRVAEVVMARGSVALVFRCKPSGGTEQTPDESTASEVYAVRRLDATTSDGPRVRNHDGRQLMSA